MADCVIFMSETFVSCNISSLLFKIKFTFILCCVMCGSTRHPQFPACLVQVKILEIMSEWPHSFKDPLVQAYIISLY